MSEINFLATARQGDIIEIGVEAINYGRTSITISCVVRNMRTKQLITAVEKLVFVKVDENGYPVLHGKVHPIDREFAYNEMVVRE